MHPAPFLVRTPCTVCGQPIAADFPVALGTARATRCSTCGASQTDLPAGNVRKAGSSPRPPGATTPSVAPVWGSRTQRIVLVVLLVALAAAVSYRVLSRDDEAVEVGGPGRGYPPQWERRHTTVRWRANAVVSGGLFPPGTDCTIQGAFKSDTRRVIGAELAIDCGATAIYRGRSRDGLQCAVLEGPGIGFGVWEYNVMCHDAHGTSLDTSESRARVAAAGTRPAIDLAVVRDDGVQAAAPLYETSIGVFRWRGERRYRAQVVASKGPDAPRLGEACDVRLLPNSSDDVPCRVLIRCGQRVVYGGFGAGFTGCVLNANGPVLATDDQPTGTDGDPVLHLDAANLRASVRDEAPAWSTEFDLTLDTSAAPTAKDARE